MAGPDLYWLPPPPADWRARVAALSAGPASDRAAAWAELRSLAGFRLSFPATNALDAALRKQVGAGGEGLPTPTRLAVLATSTTGHLAPALRVGALRRGIALDVYEPDYGQYLQEIADPGSALHAFKPATVLLAFDANSTAAHAKGLRTVAEASAETDRFVDRARQTWAAAKARLGAAVIQQTVVPRLPAAGGSNDHRDPASGAGFIAAVNARLRAAAEEAGVDLLALDARVAQDGLDRWFSPSSWHGAKQEVALPAAPVYGDLVARLLAARRGLGAKACVFDLDNTLWGGVIGDDGLAGIVVGQGRAAGEAFLDVQHYALALHARGILLAVCSKNDEAVALEPFERHPDMVLRREHVTCFVANWDDKATNLRRIAKRLNIGLDALVFVDDNPFERALVRKEVPDVFVPEVPDDVALVPRCLADAGCFELVQLTAEDAGRGALYAADAERARLLDEVTDLDSYLADLGMVLRFRRAAEADIARVTQLINKTNQFNLATRRLGEDEVRRMAADPAAAVLQFRLVDRFGDNGIIAVVTGHRDEGTGFVIDDWLMSCRVLGRQVEEATLNVVAAAARALGATALHGRYRPTPRNGMVAGLLDRLGFATRSEAEGGVSGTLDLTTFTPRPTAIREETVAP